MEVKTVQSQLVYYKSFETTLRDITKYVKDTPEKIVKEIQIAGIEIVGPQIWLYEGGDGQPDTKFLLSICMPIKESKEGYEKNIQTLDEFKCASTVHNGPWENLKDCYSNLMGEIFGNNHKLAVACREIYLTCDVEKPENNVTEVQMGIL